MTAVFIVGEQRSDSNLLRLMLAQAGIAAPHPAHLLTRMMPLAASSVAQARFIRSARGGYSCGWRARVICA